MVDLVALDESASIPEKIVSVAGVAKLASRRMLLEFDNCVDRREALKTRPPVSLQAVLFREILSIERRMAFIAFKPPQLLNKDL